MSVRGGLVLAVALACCVDSRQARAETFENLATRIPRDANALVLIDVEQLLETPLARNQGWARKLEVANVERPVILPPTGKKLVLGADLQIDDDFRPAWELAVIELGEALPVRTIATNESGHVDQVSGLPVAFTPSDAAFVDLGNQTLAVLRPADRQFLSRWISHSRDKPQAELSDYLQSSLQLVTDRAQVLLAIDLTDVVSPHDINEKLSKASWLPAAKTGAVAAVVEKLRGANLRLAVGEQCQAQLQIDFDADVAPLADVAKPLVLEALGALGFQTDELSKWEVSASGKSIRMQGVLPPDGQRRVFSVIDLPMPPTKESAAPPSSTPVSPESAARDASLAYFKSTQVLVADLRKGLKETSATSAWTERYARRIDELPVLNVDDLLLDYGDKLAETLRIMALSKRQAGIRAGVRATQGGGYYDGYSYGEDAYASAADRSQAKKEEMAVASDTRVEGWRLIDDATADIRKTLTKKYKVEF